MFREALVWLAIFVLVILNAAYYTGALTFDAPRTQASTPAGLRPDVIAESDASRDLPGRFVPTQGRLHTDPYPLGHVDFCPEEQISDDCYASNPPTSGRHLPVEPLVVLPDGHRLKIPPDPGVYDFAIPREAIPHIEEHAGVYVGYNCASGQCEEALGKLKALVEQELSLNARVVLTPDPDLDEGTIGLAAWTRVDVFPAKDYDDARVRDFIKAHSCRFDPERFCKTNILN